MKRIVFIILALIHFFEVYSQDNIKHRYVVSRIFTQYPFDFTSTSTATVRFDDTVILNVTAVADDNPDYYRIDDRNIITFDNKISELRYYSNSYDSDPNNPPPCTESGTLDVKNNGEIFDYYANCFVNGAASVRALYIDSFANNNEWFENTELNVCESIELRTMPDVHIQPSWFINFEVEYSTDGMLFQNLYPKVKDESFILSYEDILSKEPDFDIENDNLFLRLRYFANDEATTSNDYSDIIKYHFIDCSPELTNISTVDAQCSYSNDGSFTAEFKRVLDASKDERMLVHVEKYNSAHGPETDDAAWEIYKPDYQFILPDDIPDNPNLYVDAHLQWPEILESGVYRLRWLSKYGGEDPSANPNSAERSSSFEVTSPSPVTFTTSVNQPSCGSDKGTITVNASGGNDLQQGSYQYSRDNGNTWQDSNVFTESQGSSHTIKVLINLADGNQCVSPGEEIININTIFNPLDITGAFAIQQPTFSGATNGQIYVEIANGNPPFRYEALDGNTIVGSVETMNRYATIIDLEEGDYSIQVIDNYGNGNQCSDIYDNDGNLIVLEAPEPISIESENHTDITCHNKNDGTINVTVTGGWLESGEDYIYEWRNSEGNVVGSNSPTISDLGEDTYTITVTDSNNDLTNSNTFASQNIEIENPAPIQIVSVIAEDITCNGAGDGQITVTISGGAPPYEYRLGNTTDFTDLPVGTDTWPINVESSIFYNEESLEIRDSNECSILYDQEIQINEPDVLTVNENQDAHVDNNIYGGSIGALSITVSGGTLPYKSIVWSNSEDPGYTGSGTSLSNLKAGSYQVVITDAQDCTISLEDPIEIIEPDLLEITSAIPTHVNCYEESTGSIALTVTGGIPPHHYQWSKQGDAGFSAPDTNEITGLSQGTYEVTVTDTGSPATTSTSVVINQQPQVQIDHTKEDNICYNDNQGSIDLTVTGGTPPYSYHWSNGETTEDVSGLQSGPYTVEVTDDLGCTSNYEVTIGQPDDAVGLNSIDITQITAYGYDNGTIDIEVTGGEPPYIYEWFGDNGFTSAEQDISGLAPGDYTLIVYDANYETSGSTACTIMEEFEIREPGELLVNISEEYSLFCYGDQNGELLANVTGGVIPYSYQWYRVENGSALDQDTQSPFITDIGEGHYRVTITDANGIEVTSEDYHLSHPEELVLQTVSTTNVLCYGEATGAIDMQVSGGVLPYTITWNDGATTLDRENLTASNYTITVEDANGCSQQSTVEILHPYQELRIEHIDVTDVTRFDGNDGSLTAAFSGGASPHSITWTRESTQTTEGNTATITNLMAGDYTVVITDANDCSVSQTYSVTEPDIVEATLINPTCAGLCDASLSISILERPGNYTYTWNTGSTSSTLTGLCAGTYTVSIGGFGDRILERTYEIIDPAPLVVDLGEDRVLCEDQTHTVNAAIADMGAQYQWTSDTGFSSTSPEVELTQPGTYSLTVTNSIGCIGTDAITISRTTTVIGAEFAVSSQVYTGESVVLVDLSNPTPDLLEWVLPEEAEVVTSEGGYAEVVFKQAGEYVFGMYTELGECQAYHEKKVVVIEREKFTEGEEVEVSENERNSFIKNYMVYPNPSDGAFTLEIGLREEKPVSVRIFGLVNNAMIDYRTLQNKKDYLVEYDLRHVSAGVYFVVLETPVSTQVKKLIIE